MSKPCSSKGSLGLVTNFWLFLTLPLLGCGPDVIEVSGKVTFKGRPLSSGSVIFVGQDGQPKVSAIAKDGSYLIKNAPIGPVKIGVASHLTVPPGLNPLGKATSPGGHPKDDTEKIPERYKLPENSGLTCPVERGSHTFNIDLKP